MAKKLICFPFINGNLQEWTSVHLSDEERERVYNGEDINSDLYKWGGGSVVWRPNEEVELTLRYKDYGRGRSAVTFYWEDENGHEYPMFIKDMHELLLKDIGISKIHAIWTYVKRGANYGIKFLREAKG